MSSGIVVRFIVRGVWLQPDFAVASELRVGGASLAILGVSTVAAVTCPLDSPHGVPSALLAWTSAAAAPPAAACPEAVTARDRINPPLRLRPRRARFFHGYRGCGGLRSDLRRTGLRRRLGKARRRCPG